MIVETIAFANRAALAAGLCRRVAHVLSKTITEQGTAVLAVSGGSTPTAFFDHMTTAPISWDKVTVALVDERQVPEDHARSNARLVRQHLLKGTAATARFVPLHGNPAAADIADFSACVLGMGSDGHTASFFPGGDRLVKAIDPSTEQSIIEINAPGAGEPRLTYTLAKILRSRFLALHIEGEEKKAVLARAGGDGAAEDMPIRAVLRSKQPLHVYWCP